MEWKDIKPREQKEPSRFVRIVNGDADKIHGYDDGEWMESQRPADYYSEHVDHIDELAALHALKGTNIY